MSGIKLNDPMTVKEAAVQLRKFAELTASNSKNWDNFEAICLDFLTSALKAGEKP